jgi:Zn finger protein HypA/HybF involved in hydrogenase expression
MLTIDCPVCDRPTAVDEALATLDCPTCGSADVAVDQPLILERAA